MLSRRDDIEHRFDEGAVHRSDAPALTEMPLDEAVPGESREGTPDAGTAESETLNQFDLVQH